MEEAGHHKMTAGVALWASGGGLVALGTILAIAGAHDGCPGSHVGYHDAYHANICSNGLAIAGASVGVIGSAALVAGIPVYILGTGEVGRARALRRRLWVAPQVQAGPHGAAVSLAAPF
jgi:hypothetical protein